MCFHIRLSKEAVKIENRFNANFEDPDSFIQSEHINGFAHPRLPVITNEDQKSIQLFNWGLIPFWAKDESIRKYTLNARIESIRKKPAFRQSVQKRCLVIVNGFYEWQWLDSRGKKKQKYLIQLPGEDIFCLAGLWSEWVEKESGEVIESFTIVTTEANEQMSVIHNSKKRMPVILKKEEESEWLKESSLTNFLTRDFSLEAIQTDN
ncbi:MAG: SOS response-associated peptidase [Chitinophagaceae bacterium]|nr:MAG: SOS response-associated peptidase [Chitinophagaceae bacterium]